MDPVVQEDLDAVDLDQIEGPPLENTQHLSKCLVGKLISDKSANSFAIMDVMKRAWKAKNRMDAREWTNNLFLFKFEDPAEMNWVVKNQPWHFEGNLFSVRPLRDNEQPSSISINEAHMWVRIYDAPTSCMAKVYAQAMAKKLGKLVDFDTNHDFFGKYMRIKVEVDITKPLKRGLAVVVGGVKMWLPIKYEGLPLFCYHCGRIGHMFKACDELDHKEEQNPQEMAYGPDLKASPVKKIRLWPPKDTFSRPPQPKPNLNQPTKSSSSSPSDSLLTLGSSTHKQIQNREPLNLADLLPTKINTSNQITYLTDNPTDTPTDIEPPTMDIDRHTPLKPQKLKPTQTEISSHDALSSQNLTPHMLKNNNKKEWKRLARGKVTLTSSSMAKEKMGKRPLSEENHGKIVEHVEAKRLKFLALSVDDKPTAEVAKEQPRRSK